MKRLSLILLLATLMISAYAQQVTLSISNPSDYQRQEVVETDLNAVYDRLGITINEPFIIKNGFGQEQTYQKTYDGKLLMYIAIQPHSKATFTITKGQPSPFKSFVFGKIYLERADDLTWENDRGIYRMYGPALQRSGEKAFGTDIWVKNTPELVVEERYRQHMWGVAKRDSLNRIGKNQEANDIYMATSFHHDHGYGLDCYAVGQSLGCGAPALLKDEQLLFPYCWQKCYILDNGPLRFTAELTYGTNSDGITEHRIVSLDKGSHFNRIKVYYDGLTEPLALASGVVLHHDHDLLLGKNYVLYADPTENPDVHQSQIYVGTLYPEDIDETLFFNGPLNHALGILYDYKGEPYTYYFGSAWSKYDVPTLQQWQRCAEEFMNNIKNPLNIELQ